MSTQNYTDIPNQNVIKRSDRIQNILSLSYIFCAVEFISNDSLTMKEAIVTKRIEERI